MKRSRRSEYDKKRNRSKKHSERKFSFKTEDTSTPSRYSSKAARKAKAKDAVSTSNSNSNSNSNSIDRFKSFEINENNEKKYKYREVAPKERSGCFNYKLPLAVVIIIAVVRLLMSLGSIAKSSSTVDPNSFANKNSVEEYSKAATRQLTNFMIYGKTRPLREVAQLQKDSTFVITDNVKVRLFKGFHLYDASSLPSTEIFAKFSKYYFSYDKVSVLPTYTMTEQWRNLRKKHLNKIQQDIFSSENTKSYTFKGMQIEEKEFKINIERIELHGVATLVETENTRYFFQFISQEKKDAYFRRAYLKKYLNFYLKIR